LSSEQSVLYAVELSNGIPMLMSFFSEVILAADRIDEEEGDNEEDGDECGADLWALCKV